MSFIVLCVTPAGEISIINLNIPEHHSTTYPAIICRHQDKAITGWSTVQTLVQHRNSWSGDSTLRHTTSQSTFVMCAKIKIQSGAFHIFHSWRISATSLRFLSGAVLLLLQKYLAGMARARKAARIIKYKTRLRSRKIRPECNLPHEGRSQCHV